MVAGVLAQFDGEFVGPEVNWFALSPLLALAGGALLLMLLGALTPPWPRGLYAAFGATVAGTAGALAMVQWDDITDEGPRTLVGGGVDLVYLQPEQLKLDDAFLQLTKGIVH